MVVEAAEIESIPLADRVAWLRAAHPDVTVIGVRCDVPTDFGDEPIWAAQLAVLRAALAGRPPVDVVFTSEKYGTELAARLGARHVSVDPHRMRVPVSGTAVRADLGGHWDFLDPVVRAGLAVRCVFAGAGSTGTTTISSMLADRFRARGGVFASTRWVPEYGKMAVPAGSSWTPADFARIATEQTLLENAAAGAGSPLLVCDTDAFATSLWERRYLGSGSPSVDGLAPRVYLVTDHVGVPSADDGQREGDLAVRAATTSSFVAELTALGQSWVLLTGSVSERLELATKVADQFLAWRSSFADPLS